ncbi:transposase [Persicitalea sp.]|uniref:transposase n=1 Tax=Persicitalea sp. TaxID=3100273 RepID=UPI0035940F06
MHEDKKRRKYDAAFKAEVLRMVESGQSVRYAAGALGISENLIHTWKSKNKMGKGKTVRQGELSVENQQLKERVRQREAERDISKKALRTPRGAFSAARADRALRLD